MLITEKFPTEICPLCKNTGTPFYRLEFFICKICSGIFRNKKSLPTPEVEKKRYDLHQNNVNDKGYLKFVAPISEHILSRIPNSKKGLDYGCGPSSAIFKILAENDFFIQKFDPFYFPDKNILNSKYDFIVCCEVIEHFHQPAKEFETLKKMLNYGGELLVMTHLFDSSILFENWYYKNDFTHVFFYQALTIEWIKNHYNFSELVIQNRFIRLKN